MRLLILLICLLGISCSGQKGASKDKADSTIQNSKELQLVLKDNYSGVEESVFQVVRDPKALRNFFIQINKTRKPGLPIPEVDFSKELLLIYCAGTTLGVGGTELFVIEDSQDNMVVGSKERIPSGKEITNINTTPFIIYKMPLTPKEISFRKLD
jgi:hypothetical protein